MVRAAAALLAALLALPVALAQGGDVAMVTLDVLPDATCGKVVILSGASPGAVDSYPYTFTAPAGTVLTLSASPAAGYRLWKWLVNGTEYQGGVLQLAVTGGSIRVTAVFALNTTVSVVKTVVGNVYVSTAGYMWVEPAPLTLDVLPLRQQVAAYINTSATWQQVREADPLNLTARLAWRAQPSYTLVLVNRCAETCYPVTFHVYSASGDLAAVENVENGEATLPWQDSTAVIFITVAGRTYGPFLAAAAAPAARVPEWLAPLAALLPLALFVALGVRSSAREAAVGMVAYAFFSSIVLALLGLPRAAAPVAGTTVTIAVILLLVDKYARQ